MKNHNRFNVSDLKGKLGKIRDWMTDHNMPPKLVFFLLGIISTIWFLIRVIPKPSRATYPCMRVAAPFMSGFVTYLLAVAGFTALSRKIKSRFLNVRYFAAALLTFGAIVVMAISPIRDLMTSDQTGTFGVGPDDGPNQPFGNPTGIFPGRVVWVWNPDATNEKFEHNDFAKYDWFVNKENINEQVVGKMFRDGILKLTGKNSVANAWDAVFHNFNTKKLNNNKGYTKGEMIFVKINQGQSRWVLEQDDKNKGYYIPRTVAPGSERRLRSFIPTETSPYFVLELLRELVNECGVNQEDIWIGDPMCPIWGHNYEVWAKEFPKVKYIDRISDMHGRTLIKYSENPLVFYADKVDTDKLYDVVEKADYLINMTVMKPHGAAGISLTAKSHFGDIGRPTAGHLHRSHIANRREGSPSNGGYGKYRVFVDLMGSKYLGQNTCIWIVEALFGGGSSEIMGPVKYFMPPFNNDWCNSLFLSLDPVAIESVGYDFLRTEWDGTHTHDAVNNDWESMVNTKGVDDYIHQVADPSKRPADIFYDPDNSGKTFGSLGVHEHWNNATDKQYSRNLGTGKGIELVSIPDNLVKNVN